MKSLITYLRNVRTELDYVVWPTQQQALSHVVVIVLVSAVTMLLVAGLDLGFTSVVDRLASGY